MERPDLQVLEGEGERPDIEPKEKPVRGVDWRHLQTLGHIAGNPFYEEPPDDAA